MRPLASTLLLCSFLPTLLGVYHCERGDALAFEEQPMFRSLPFEPWPAPMPLATLHYQRTGLWSGEFFLQVYVGRVEAVAVDEQGAQRLQPVKWHDLAAFEQLHRDLAEAGAADIGDVEDCWMTTGHDSRGQVVFFEPAVPRGRAWANTFTFENCPMDPRVGQVLAVLQEFTTETFGRGF